MGDEYERLHLEAQKMSNNIQSISPAHKVLDGMVAEASNHVVQIFKVWCMVTREKQDSSEVIHEVFVYAAIKAAVITESEWIKSQPELVDWCERYEKEKGWRM